MTRFTILRAVVLLLVLSFAAQEQLQAQFLKGLKDNIGNAVERTVNRKVEQKVEEAVEDAVDEVLEGEKGTGNDAAKQSGNSTGTSTENGNVIVGEDGAVRIIEEDGTEVLIDSKNGRTVIKEAEGTTTIETVDEPIGEVLPNAFIGSFTMETKSVDKKGRTEETIMTMHFDEYRTVIEMPNVEDGEQVRMIMDNRDRTTTTLIDNKGEKTGIKMKIPKTKVTTTGYENETEANPDMTFTRTDQTKTIDGHLCTLYIIEDDKTRTEAWIAEDFDINFAQAFSSYMNMDTKNQKRNNNFDNTGNFQGIKGFPLESKSVSKKDASEVEMYMKDISVGEVNTAAFSTAGYEVQDMTNFMNMFKMGGN